MANGARGRRGGPPPISDTSVREAVQCETPTELVPATKNTGERCGDHLVVHCGDILQAYLAEGDELVVLGPTDLDPPELLRAPLLDRDGDDVQPARSVRSHEVGDIRDSDRLLALVLDALVGAGRRERLDRRCEETPMHDTPGLVVSFVGGDRTADLGPRDLVALDLKPGHQVARCREVGHRTLLNSLPAT